MKITFFFVIVLIYKASTHYNGILSRNKRDSSGALNIVTNHAPAIHADVKDDSTGPTNKPCPKTYVGNSPSNIESGVVFKVTPPKDTIYDGKSLRKSLPLTTKLDLVRAVNRIVTLITLVFSAVLEFYPLVQHMYKIIDEFINLNKY